MNVIELLRFDWSRSQGRLLLAALADAGPVTKLAWSVRSGVPRNHLLATVEECARLGGLKAECRPEGLALFVQPVEFWRVTPLADAGMWSGAWRDVAQERLAMVTEEGSLAGSLAGALAVGRGSRVEGRELPESGGVPESGGLPTYRRSDVPDPKRITSIRSTPESERARAGAGARLTERVRTFVGERDWRRYWEHEDAQAIFADAARAEVLESSLRYCQAALKEGVRVRKNTGAMLWEDYRRGLGKVLVRV